MSAISFPLLSTVYAILFYRSRNCRVENACTTLTNFCSKGKVMLFLSMVRYQVLLCFRHTRHNAIAINKLQVFYHVNTYHAW